MRKSFYLDHHIRYLKNRDWLEILLTVLFWIVFAFGLLLSLYYLLFCFGLFADAMQSLRKFSGLGFSHSYWYYLAGKLFCADAISFILVTVQLLLYIVQYRRANCQKPSWISVLYFIIMAAFHLCLYLHANSLVPASIPEREEAALIIRRYCVFSRLSLIQPFLYLAVYLMGMWKHQKNCKSGDGPLS